MKFKYTILAFLILIFAFIFKRQIRIVENTNPQRIVLDDVAKFFFMPKWLAGFFMKLCVKAGDFKAVGKDLYALVRK